MGKVGKLVTLVSIGFVAWSGMGFAMGFYGGLRGTERGLESGLHVMVIAQSVPLAIAFFVGLVIFGFAWLREPKKQPKPSPICTEAWYAATVAKQQQLSIEERKENE